MTGFVLQRHIFLKNRIDTIVWRHKYLSMFCPHTLAYCDRHDKHPGQVMAGRLVVHMLYNVILVKTKSHHASCCVFRDLEKLGSHVRKTALLQQQSIKTEWKLAKIAFVVIIVFVLSWSPYASVTLIAWAGYGNYFTFSHLADAIIQSDLQIRKITKSEKSVNTKYTHWRK